METQTFTTMIPLAIMLLTFGVKSALTEEKWDKVSNWVPLTAMFIGLAISGVFSATNGIHGWDLFNVLFQGAEIGAAAVGFHQAIVRTSDAVTPTDGDTTSDSQ